MPRALLGTLGRVTVPSGRIVALTGLRGIAVALVVLAHAHVQHLSVGSYGVDVFFVLSGFLITNVLRDLAPFDARSWKLFLGRRAARLLPALAVTLVALAGWVLLTGVAGGGRCLALATTHTMDLPVGAATTCPGPLHITWSLAAEEQFYLVWPLLVVLLSRVPVRRAVLACLAAYAACWVVSDLVARYDEGAAGWWSFFPPGRPSALLLGSALAFVLPLRSAGSRVLAPGLGRLAGPLFAVGLVTTAVLLAQEDGPRQVVLGPLVAVPATLLVAVLALAPSGTGPALFRSPWLVWLGEISYSLYLVHVLALHLLRDLRDDDSLITNGLGVAIALAGAWALHRYVEQPFRTRGYAWLRQRERALEPARTPTLVG
jgi:peptidoglycan/LPS O-acetylase OafA/YrhL